MDSPDAPILPPPIPAVKSPPPLPKPPGPRIGLALLVSLIAVASSIMASVPLAFYYALSHAKHDVMLTTLVGQVFSWPLALWLGLVFINRPWSGSYAIKRFPLRILPGLIMACFGLTIVLGFIAGLIPMPQAFKDLFSGMRQGNAVAFFVAISLIAPLAEELFFRGWMLRGFFRSYSPAKSIWLTAVIFALFHLNPWQGVVALPLGLLCGWLVLRTGSLAPGMIGHFVLNFSSSYLVLPLALLLGHTREEWKAAEQVPGDVLAIGAILSVAGLLLLGWSLRVSHTVPRTDSPQEKISEL